MFATATKNFVDEVDNGGLLIPVSSLNDSLVLLSLVIKRKRFWFFQKPKYLLTDFNLNDILMGDTPITPIVKTTDFTKYNGTFGGNIQGEVEANVAQSSVSVEGQDKSKLQSSFGSLKKEEVDVQKLLCETKDRVLDMSHCLIQQTMEKRKEVFGFVKERIVTTQPCSVIEEVQMDGKLGILGMCAPKITKVSLKHNASLNKDSNISLEIPPNTPIAYSVIELEVKLNGQFELCLMSDTNGGFEVDGPAKRVLMGCSGVPVLASANTQLKQELERLSGHFQLLSALPASTRSSLLQNILLVMENSEAVGALENVLDHLCRGTDPTLEGVTPESHRQNIQVIVDICKQSGCGEQPDRSTSTLSTIHLLVSALDEMTDEALSALRKCCSPTVLQALQLLMQCVTECEDGSLSNPLLAPLTGEVYATIEHLLACSNVTLKKNGQALKTEVTQEPDNSPLVLCIVVRGLSSLSPST